MGLFGLTGTEPEYVAANERIISAAKANKVPLMAYTPRPEMFRKRVQEGFNALMVSADFATLALGTINDLETSKRIAAEHGRGRDETC